MVFIKSVADEASLMFITNCSTVQVICVGYWLFRITMHCCKLLVVYVYIDVISEICVNQWFLYCRNEVFLLRLSKEAGDNMIGVSLS